MAEGNRLKDIFNPVMNALTDDQWAQLEALGLEEAFMGRVDLELDHSAKLIASQA